MMDILSDKVVITRKPHVCSACRRKFEKGTKMRRQVNTYDGIQQWYECPTCMELLSTYRDRFNDEYGWCEEGCVDEVRGLGQTPEQLLEHFNKPKE